MKTFRVIFIVAPASAGDSLHIVCGTNDLDSVDDIYGTDRCTEIERCGSLEEALAVAKQYGAENPEVI